MAKRKSLMARIGPAFIVGACVIGPGSVTTMSTTGANYGYSLVWLSLLAGVFTAGFLALFMRLGCYSDKTFLEMTALKLGRKYAFLCGITIFMVSAAFQFGNSLGVTAGMEVLIPSVSPYVWPIAFTLAAIFFMFGLKQIYGTLEKMMTFFLAFMVLAFLVNLIWAIGAKDHPMQSVGLAIQGACIPTIPKDIDLLVIGALIGTTFCVSAILLQTYLVQAKKWKKEDLKDGIADTLLASFMLTMIGAIIMMTAAAVLYPQEGRITFEIMVGSLENVFGSSAKYVFSVGFWAAAFSSFIANSLTGGVLLNDAFGWGGKIDSKATKYCATFVLFVGMAISLVVIHKSELAKTAPQDTAVAQAPATQGDSAQPVPAKKKTDLKVTAILIGQASTMLAIPLAAIALIFVLFDSKFTDNIPLSIPIKAFVILGACLLLGITAVVVVKIQPALLALFGSG